jgi:recombination protein RecA
MIFTNQLRMKIGVMFGSPETTSGGRALKFYATVRLDVRRIKSIKVKGEVIGHTTRVRVTKNKVAPPFRVAEFDIMFGEGISHEGDLLDVGLDLGILDQRGSYYYYDDDNFAQGRENSKVYFQENPEFADKIEALIREELAERNKKKEKVEADEEESEDVDDDEDGEDEE